MDILGQAWKDRHRGTPWKALPPLGLSGHHTRTNIEELRTHRLGARHSFSAMEHCKAPGTKILPHHGIGSKYFKSPSVWGAWGLLIFLGGGDHLIPHLGIQQLPSASVCASLIACGLEFSESIWLKLRKTADETSGLPTVNLIRSCSTSFAD